MSYEIVTNKSTIITNDEAIVQYYREQGAQIVGVVKCEEE